MLRAFVKQEKETFGKEVVYARTIIEDWRCGKATSGRQAPTTVCWGEHFRLANAFQIVSINKKNPLGGTRDS